MCEDDVIMPAPPRRRRGLLVYAVVAVIAAAAGIGSVLVVRYAGLGPRGSRADVPAIAMNDTAVYGRVEPGVVDISADLQYLNETAEGTGFVINAADGLVLTNNHVIDGATTVLVTLVSSGKSYQARVLGYDLPDDIALLQVKGAPGLRAVTVGDSADLSVGMQVLALGNEAGQGGQPTIAAGVISSMGRSIIASDASSGLTETLHGMLQVTADIRPGDSGGPLANAAGQVIGINTAAGSGGPGMDFAGYAIPIGPALAVARQIAEGHAGRNIQLGLPAFLGVVLPQSSSPDPRQQAGPRRASQTLPVDGAPSGGPRSCLTGTSAKGTQDAPARIAPVRSGALVDGVLCGTAAATAGLAAGDVITAIDGRTVTSASALTATLDVERPGGKIYLSWVNTDGGLGFAVITLSAGPAG